MGVSGCNLVLIFLRHEIRVEFQLNRADAAENKWLFDRLAERSAEFEESFGDGLEWRRMDEKKVSMIVCKLSAQGYSKENWPELIEWLIEHYRKMDSILSEPVRSLAARMKPGGVA